MCMCCSVLQQVFNAGVLCAGSKRYVHICVALCCIVLQCIAFCGSVLQCVAVCCSVL